MTLFSETYRMWMNRLLATTQSNSATNAGQAAAQYTVPEVQAAPSYNLASGIETSTSSLGITYANAFMT